MLWLCYHNLLFLQTVHVNVEETVVKEEEITEEELMEQDPLEVAGTPVKKERIEDEQLTINEEFVEGDLESKIEIVDDMLELCKS